VKLAPYFDVPHFQRAADVINGFPEVRFVVCTNTIGNALVVDGEHEMACISPKEGFGGLGGGFVKAVALANVRMLSKLLRADVDVVGVGGVKCGMDAFELLLCGAKAVQVGTTHWSEGAKCFDRIAGELEDILKRKGYSDVSQVIGKLKPYKRPTDAAGAKRAVAAPAPAKGGGNESFLQAVIAALALLVALLLARDQGLIRAKL